MHDLRAQGDIPPRPLLPLTPAGWREPAATTIDEDAPC